MTSAMVPERGNPSNWMQRRGAAWRAAVLVFALACAGAVQAGDAVTPAEARHAIDSDAPPQVLDVRTAEEFAQGHVPGAVLIPHDQLAQRLQELDPTRPVLVYCRSGRRSTEAEGVLAANGFDVRQIEGSWLRWQEERLPVERPVRAADEAEGSTNDAD